MSLEPDIEIKTYGVMKLFAFVSRRHKKIFENMMMTLPLHGSQHYLLVFLVSANPDISQKEIAEELKVSTAAVAVALKRLESEGYISRKVSESDNRFNEIVITEKGRDILSESSKIFKKLNELTFRNFSSRDINDFYFALNKINDNLALAEGAEVKNRKGSNL